MSSATWHSGPWQQGAVQGAPALLPAPWSSPSHPGPRTDLLAVLAILAAAAGTTVLLGLGSVAAIVLGIIALGRIRRTGDDGRLLAIGAVAVGAVTLVALVAATALTVAAVARALG